MLFRPLTRPLASSCLSKLFNFLTSKLCNLSKHLVNNAVNLAKVTLPLHANNAAASKCDAALPVQCACWARLAIIMLGPSVKHSSSFASLASLPLDWAQNAQSPYSLLFFFLWRAQTMHVHVIASTCNQQRDHLNQTLFPLWGFEVLSLSLSCPEWTHLD